MLFQAQLAGQSKETAKNLPFKKFYIILDATQDSYGIHFTTEKSQKLKPTGNFVNIIRKHAKTFVITDIIQEQNGDIWVTVHTPSGSTKAPIADHYLLLRKSRPPELSLMETETKNSLVRISAHYSQTKKKLLDREPPYELTEQKSSRKVQSISNILWDKFISKHKLETSIDPKCSDSEENEDQLENQATYSQEQKVLIGRLKRRLKSLKKNVIKQQGQLPSEDEIKQVEKKATLLKSWSWKIQEGDRKLLIEKEISGEAEDIEIDLDEETNPGKLLTTTFQKLKKLKKSRDLGLKRIQDSERNLEQLANSVSQIKSTPMSNDELAVIAKQYKLPTMPNPKIQGKATTKTAWRCYTSSNKLRILVGKGPKENDELTKGARSNDFWIHVSSGSGSHVIVPTTKETRERLPEATFKEAAILAIHFSGFRKDMGGEVYFTRKSNIRKTKDLAPGLWLVTRSETFFIRYSEVELKGILDRLEV